MAPDSAGLGPEVAAAIWLVLSLSIPSSPAVFTRCGKKVPGFVARETEGMCATATAYSKEHRHPPSLAMMVVAIPGLWNGRVSSSSPLILPEWDIEDGDESDCRLRRQIVSPSWPSAHRLVCARSFPIASVMDLRQLLASSRGAVACVAPVSGLRPSLHWFRPPSQSPRAAATLRLCGVTRTRVERREFPIPSVMDLRQLCSPMHRLSIWSLAFPSLVPRGLARLLIMPVLNLCQQAPPSCTQRTPNLALSSCSSRKTLLGPLGVVEVFPVFAETLRVFVVIPDTQKCPPGRGGFAAIAPTLISSAECIPSNGWRFKRNESPAENIRSAFTTSQIRYPPPLLIPGPQLAAPPTAKIAVAVVIRQTCQNRYFSFFDQYAIAAQRTLAVPTAYPPGNDCCRAHLFVLPTRWEVSLSLEGVGNTSGSPNLLEIPNVDTLLGAVDTTMSSWTVKPKLVQITIKLCFPTPELLDAFLFALSYVRLSDSIEPRSPSTVPLTERRLTQQDVQRFSEMRVSVYRRQATIAVLPVELLSKIFSLLPSFGRRSTLLLPSSDRRSTFASTLLPLWVCSEWRSVAIGTASLWRSPPTFTFSPSFFRRGGRHQTLLWLARAKGRNVDLSITIPTRFSLGIPFLLQSSPSILASAQSLTLACPPSHIQPLLGSGGPILPSLETLWLQICLPLPGHEPSFDPELCRSAPLLRCVFLETDRLSCPRPTFNLLAIFPWPQLTSLSIRMRLEIHAWLTVFSECTSLRTGKFVLFQDGPSTHRLKTVTLSHLVSLRLILHCVSHTHLFNHLTLPALRELHVGGTLGSDAHLGFLANYPALSDLTVDLDLLDKGVHDATYGRSPLERLSTFGDIPAFPGAGLQQLRDLTILTSISISTPTDTFLSTSARWIEKMVLTSCDFRLYGTKPIVEGFQRALGSARAFEASATFTHVTEDAFERYPRRCNYVLTSVEGTLPSAHFAPHTRFWAVRLRRRIGRPDFYAQSRVASDSAAGIPAGFVELRPPGFACPPAPPQAARDTNQPARLMPTPKTLYQRTNITAW
ncbi:hypothetical protein C8R46DRAFT_1023643 [Mycena filopes]|nr:hypothetical protein C8R46DRAFT_1023643 [Mycena filopes]